MFSFFIFRTSDKQPIDLNTFRRFNYQLRIPKKRSAKVWMRYNSIIFRLGDNFVHTVNFNKISRNGHEPKKISLQVYINELHDLSINKSSGKKAAINWCGKNINMKEIDGMQAER